LISEPQRAILVVDLGYGDAGKGTIVDYLTRVCDAPTVIRFNGGPQAAHNVITPDGRHHTFAQFGSGTLVPGVRTYLSRFMLVDPYAMFNEADHLERIGLHDVFARMAIDREALVITPYQQAANRLKEIARGSERHGSCGMGIGETASDFLQFPDTVITAGDLSDVTSVRRKLCRLRELKRSQLGPIWEGVCRLPGAQSDIAVFEDTALVEAIADNYQYFGDSVAIVGTDYLKAICRTPRTLIFEGAQGVLLDEWYGFHPFTTWSTTTFANADKLLKDGRYSAEIVKFGVVRTYFTRHGPGPFVTEDERLTGLLIDKYNVNNQWQHSFRIGHFDLVASRYALQAAGPVDALAVTHLDRLPDLESWFWCDRYQYHGSETLDDFFECDERGIKEIRVGNMADLSHQAALTRRLLQCTAQYSAVNLPSHPAARADNYLHLLEQALQIPIRLASYGPTANEKQLSFAISGSA